MLTIAQVHYFLSLLIHFAINRQMIFQTQGECSTSAGIMICSGHSPLVRLIHCNLFSKDKVTWIMQHPLPSIILPLFKGLGSLLFKVTLLSRRECLSETLILIHQQEMNRVPNQIGGFKFIMVYYCHIIITSMSNNVIVSVSNNNNTTMQFSYSCANTFGSSMHSGINEETKESEI